MAERGKKDEIIDDAIDALIDDDLEGFHLNTVHSGGRVGSVHYDKPEPITINADGESSFSSTVKLYYHVQEYLGRLEEENDKPVTIEDVFHTLLYMHDEMTIHKTSQDINRHD